VDWHGRMEMGIRVPVELNDNAVSHYVVLSASSIGISATSIIIHGNVKTCV
jgi:hypothetical protein